MLLLQIFTGGDFSSLLTGGGSAGAGPESEITNCDTGDDANARVDCRLAAGAEVIDDYWSTQVDGYRAPQLIIVDQQTDSACGTASNATGPFYCPPEETVYIDPTFFDVLEQQFGDEAGSLAQLYVLAHEYGHHIQQLTGVFDAYPNNGTGPDSNSVRTELQADCYAGRGCRMPRTRRTARASPTSRRRPRRRSATPRGRRRRRRRPHPGAVRRRREPRELDARVERTAPALVQRRLPGRSRRVRHVLDLGDEL